MKSSYPDFIPWVREGSAQRIIFVAPHSLLHETPPQGNEKVGLHRKLQAEAGSGLKKLKNVTVDVFFVSSMPYDKLRNKWVRDHGTPWSRKEFAKEHVLFPERDAGYDYLAHILE